VKQKIKEIKFAQDSVFGSHFDIIDFQGLLKKRPADHSQFELHKVSFYVILLITSGKGRYNLNFEDLHFKKQTLFTIRKESIHKFYKSDAKGILLVFTKNFIQKHSNKLEASKILMLFNEMLSSPKLQLSPKDYKEITTLVDQAKKEHQGLNDDYSSVILSSIMQIIFTKLYRLKSKDNPLFENNRNLSTFLDFQGHIERHCFMNRKVSFYADKMKLSTKTLNNATKAIVNRSAKSFIDDIFMVHTKRLIINSSEPLTKIAYGVGFDEPTNFFKYFKKQSGISASEFRGIR